MDDLEMWKMKRLITALRDARGSGTSMISLILPPCDQIARAQQLLADEYGTATNIKSRVNRQSVLGAIASAQQRLKLYSSVPRNGLVLFTGTVLQDDNKEKLVNIDFEPFKPINTTLYRCDSVFHPECLVVLTQSETKYGFIVMDGNGATFATLEGNARQVIGQFNVDLPKKHGRGGQSAARFGRLRLESRHNYVRKVAEGAAKHFITNDRLNVTGLILAGSADFKTELGMSALFDPRLTVLDVVDVAYGGNSGFNQAITLCADKLAGLKFVKERRVLARLFAEISSDTMRYAICEVDVLTIVDTGAIETLVLWDSLKTVREDGTPLVEWLIENRARFGYEVELVSDQTQEGNQFVRGFGGVAAMLRYPVDAFNAHEHD